jgi:glycosyltransferase involved in cell wall biosynthesis
MTWVIISRDSAGGFYEVARVLSHVLKIPLSHNAIDALGRNIINVGSIYSLGSPYILLAKKVIAYLGIEGPMHSYASKVIIRLKKPVIITPSNYAKEELAGLGVKVDYVIPHGFDPCEVPDPLPKVGNNMGRTLFSIVLSDVKIYKLLGVKFLLRAIRESSILKKNALFLFKVPKNKGNIIRDIINEFGLSLDNFKIIDTYLSKHELYRLIGSSDFYIHVSLSDAFGLPIIEAMAVGTPVIALNAPPWNEVVNDDVGFLVKVRGEVIEGNPPLRIRIPDINSLRETLENVVKITDNGRLRNKVRNYAYERFNAHVLYLKFRDIMEQYGKS